MADNVTDTWTIEELLEDCDFSNIMCPKCNESKMLVWPEGNDIDGVINYLVCPKCRWEEKE